MMLAGGLRGTLSLSDKAGRSTKASAAVFALCVLAPVAMAEPAAYTSHTAALQPMPATHHSDSVVKSHGSA